MLISTNLLLSLPLLTLIEELEIEYSKKEEELPSLVPLVFWIENVLEAIRKYNIRIV